MTNVTRPNVLLISTYRPLHKELAECMEEDGKYKLIIAFSENDTTPEMLAVTSLILMDLDHSDDRAFELLSGLANRCKGDSIPIIAFVPHGTPSLEVTRVFEAGAHDYMAFPLCYEELLSKIKVHHEDADKINRLRHALEGLKKENASQGTPPISGLDAELTRLHGEIAQLNAEKAAIFEAYGKALHNLESMNVIINTVAAHGTFLEDQLDVALQAAQYQAVHDPLTKIFNRLGFNERLSLEQAKILKTGEPLSLIMLDIDHFKQVNDKYGHDVGDRVLLALTDCVKKHLPEICIFARWGGEEFMIMAPRFMLAQASDLAEYLRKTIEKVFQGEVESITCSFGVTEFKRGEKSSIVFERVDECLYEAKKSGRNQVRIR